MAAQSIQETQPRRVNPSHHSRPAHAAKTIPQKPEMWLKRALKAGSLAEGLACLNRLNYLDPRNPAGRRLTYKMLRRLLEREPYLEYKDENEALYVVSNGGNIALTVPKDRSVPERYPLNVANPIQPAFRWLGWAVLGLAPAGLGTLIFAPLAVLQVLQAFLRYRLDHADQIRAVLILIIASILLMISFILTFLLIIHLL